MTIFLRDYSFQTKERHKDRNAVVSDGLQSPSSPKAREPEHPSSPKPPKEEPKSPATSAASTATGACLWAMMTRTWSLSTSCS